MALAAAMALAGVAPADLANGHTGLRYTKSGECRACVHTRNYKARGVYAPDADTVDKRRAIEDHQSRNRDEYDF